MIQSPYSFACINHNGNNIRASCLFSQLFKLRGRGFEFWLMPDERLKEEFKPPPFFLMARNHSR